MIPIKLQSAQSANSSVLGRRTRTLLSSLWYAVTTSELEQPQHLDSRISSYLVIQIIEPSIPNDAVQRFLEVFDARFD
jgi:hypothetical protein